MPKYRITIRYGRPQQYHVLDLEAEGVADVLRRAADAVPAEVEEAADLVEVRLQVKSDEEREYTAG